jgi:phosphohistidine swiveling domain-containing protein
LYDTVLNVPIEGLGAAVRACFAATAAERVTTYQQRHGGAGAGMAVLVQVMVEPAAAGVAFTAHPVTGDRDQAVVTATPGLGEPLVSGEVTGEDWTVTGARTVRTRPGPADRPVLTSAQATAIAALARRVADRYGAPQDVEWAIDHEGRLWLLQARPMTALPPPVRWAAPGPGLWMRNFRLGEWLPEAVTPLFETWLLPLIEDGYLQGMQATVGVRVPFRYALVNGWYYNATPIPSPALLTRVLRNGGRRAVTVLYNALFRVGRDPAAADRAVLSGLEQDWRDRQLPGYRRLVADAAAQAPAADPHRLTVLVDELGREAGVALWYLAIVGGSAWKMEACLTRFTRHHLAGALPDEDGGAQVLLRGLPGTEPAHPPHAVHSVDWYHPVAAELPSTGEPRMDSGRHAAVAAQRATAERRCAAALAAQPSLLAQFEALLAVTQRYATIREQQAGTLTLAWPVLRTCAHRLGEHLTGIGAFGQAEDIFFCTRVEVDTALRVRGPSLTAVVAERRDHWQQQRRLAAPLTLGRPPRLVGDVIARAVEQARGTTDSHAGAEESVIVGQPASAGQATGPVRIITDPRDFAAFGTGDILVAQATTPAWTPLFGRAAAIVTDGGTLAAHASLIAREYGIPAVVGTGDATKRLQPGQRVTVDGTAGTVTIHSS